jgi:beta-lactamase superfamily II metal-dependent hydrolase
MKKIRGDDVLKLHFLNVGHGDCCILEFPEHITMVDINRNKNPDDDSVKEIIDASLPDEGKKLKKKLKEGEIDKKTALEKVGYSIPIQDPLDYLEHNNMNSIFRFISTHPHMDHLYGLGELSQDVKISNFWVPKNKLKANKSLDKQKRADDWSTYKKFRDNTSTSDKEGSSPSSVIRPLENSTGELYTADGIKILAPNPELLEHAENDQDANIMSYVLLLKYGSHKIILGGDAEKDTWKYILKQHGDEIKDVKVLKSSHHGRNSGYWEPAMQQMHPTYTIVSVGAKLDPRIDATKKYKKYTDNLLTTRWNGNITIECYEDGRIDCTPQYNY